MNQVLSFIDPSLKLMEWISILQISLYVTAFVEAYKYLGLYMVIFYAALIGVPDELGEAALIDGASTWRISLCKFLILNRLSLQTVCWY